MSAAWQPEMDHLRRRVEALEKMLCQGHPAGVACGVCRPEPVPGEAPQWSPKMLRERLCQQATCAPTPHIREEIEQLISMLDECRPLGTDGKHGDLHTSMCGCERDTPDPEPVPKWRVLANAGVRNLTSEDPLTLVLRSLANVADPSKVTTANLARIVAVAESKVGDGWQADPDRVRFKCGIQDLIDALPAWTTLGNRAASWLRDLTDGAE